MKAITRICLLQLIVVILAGCSQTKKLKVQTPVFDKQGHRGARGLMPENTITAMLKAVELGMTTLEMDVVITKDKQVVLSHEPFFNHLITTKPDGGFIEEKDQKNFNIYQMTYDEIRQFDVGLKPHPQFTKQARMKAYKPLLSDVLDSVKVYCEIHDLPIPFFNIETKTKPSTDNVFHPAPQEFVQLLMDVIEKKGLTSRVIIQSFDFRTLKALHSRHRSVMTAALIENDDSSSVKEHIRELGFRPTIYSPALGLVTPDLVKTCHDLKMKVIPWTVNDKNKIEELKSMGVDGIISDYPDLF